MCLCFCVYSCVCVRVLGFVSILFHVFVCIFLYYARVFIHVTVSCTFAFDCVLHVSVRFVLLACVFLFSLCTEDCVCVSACLFIWFYMSVWVHVFLSVLVQVCSLVCLYLGLCVKIYFYIYVCMCNYFTCVCLRKRVFIYLCGFVFVYLSASISICHPVFFPVSLSSIVVFMYLWAVAGCLYVCLQTSLFVFDVLVFIIVYLILFRWVCVYSCSSW